MVNKRAQMMAKRRRNARKKTWKELTGEPFDLTKLQFGGFGGKGGKKKD